MEQAQQKWTDSVLNSLDGMERATMPPALHELILQPMPGSRRRTVVLRRPAIWAMAAGLALLISLNIYSLMRHEGRDPRGLSMQDNPLANDYFAPAPSI